MSTKDLQYYKTLNYNIIIEKITDEDESAFIAYCNELGKLSCYGKGQTQIEALDNFQQEKDSFIEYLLSENVEIPEPKEIPSYSGIFNVRTSPLIHAKLINEAKESNISLNSLVNQLLAAGLEKVASDNKIMNKLTEISSRLESHHLEVTRQLKYQGIGYSKNEWSKSGEYRDGQYTKVA